MDREPAPVDVRRSRLAAAVDAELARGARIAAQGEFSCALVRRRQVQHWKHAIMSLITGGLWLPIWVLACLMVRREQVSLVEVADDGHVESRPRSAAR